MTLIETAPPRRVMPRRPVRVHPNGRMSEQVRPPRPRPAGAPLRYRGTGVLVSRGPHRRRPITPGTTAALAMLAALITVWLGLIAQFGAAANHAAPVPDRLAVVRVEPGETLQHVAARVAPGASTRQVADRIRELNGLDSAALDAGQTLIAPIG
ncbi:LysM peptidoglycan-binding domain-containing protein [Mycobacterium talmoniae]|uniref:Peptigoglycan-binding protein LysM n=1 Tax=Mycobacterium talmoniae TaxID=1858794 RepID=A0A1S1NID5_9MYCO|nr:MULTISPECIES: LysM peptidoglycan-binding domain-containing protein [Mycobacterium]OHV03608.1 peptigoglycan-binding protein LysM [Mycobacterium talmoniae]TDH47921.1 LysM peptidoglycan-binding domain-containing protein [Mycobacterium eburneum]